MPIVKLIGSNGLKAIHMVLLGSVIFWTGVYALKSYKIRLLSLHEPNKILCSLGLYLTFQKSNQHSIVVNKLVLIFHMTILEHIEPDVTNYI